jgi:hypothetical protein
VSLARPVLTKGLPPWLRMVFFGCGIVSLAVCRKVPSGPVKVPAEQVELADDRGTGGGLGNPDAQERP